MARRGTTVNGISYSLWDDCDTLLCKLDNAAFESFMEGDYTTATRNWKATATDWRSQSTGMIWKRCRKCLTSTKNCFLSTTQ